MTDSPGAAANIANTLASLLTEPPPRLRPRPQLKNRGSSPIDQALMAFDVALEFVTVADHFAIVADWKQAHSWLKSWQETFSAEGAPMTVDELAAAAATATVAAGRLDRDEPDTVLGGTGHWEALLDDLAEILAQRSRRLGQSERMYRVVGDGCQRVAATLKRCEERRAEISAVMEAQLSQITPNDTRARRSVIARGRADLSILSKMSCEQINAQTRRVLDLNERTAAMSVADFWASNKHLIAAD